MTQTIPAVEAAPTSTAAPAQRARPENPYADAYADFLGEVGDHVLTVSKDDGLYREMRVGSPNAGHWAWRVVTWPGYLATYGDIANGYMFTRTSDMIDFFDREGHGAYYSDGSPSIDFRYWAEKLSGNGRSQEVKEYSEKRFIQHVHDRLEEHHDLGIEAQDEYEKIVAVSKRVTARHEVDYEEWLVRLRAGDVEATYLEIDPDSEDETEFFGLAIAEKSPAELREELIKEARENSETEDEAREWLREKSEIVGQDDFWEAQLRDFNVHFLFTAYAIEMTVRLWREYEKSNDRKALAASTHATNRGLIELARARVDAEFKISTDLEVGDVSNGALVLRLAEALAKQIVARPAYVEQPAPVMAEGDSYVYVSGGLVQNGPSLPVFDTDVLDRDATGRDAANEALALYEAISAHPQARADLADTLVEAAGFIRQHGTPEIASAVAASEAARLAA